MGNALQMAYTHTEVRQAVPLVTDPGTKLLTTPPPHQRPDGVPRIHLSASLCAGAAYSGRPLGVEKSQGDDRVASERGYVASCIRTSENSPFHDVE
jgi:hypothetical protein